MPSRALRPARNGLGRVYLVMLLITVCWASNIIAGKEALTGFSALALAQLRVTCTAVIYGFCFLARGNLSKLRLTPRQWLTLALTGLAGMASNQIFFICGMERTSVAHTGLIVALGPVMVLVIAVVLRMEPLTSAKFVGMMISFAGVAVLTADRAGRGSGGRWTGDLIILAGTAVFAVYTVMMKEIADDYDTLTLNTLVFGLAAVEMAPFCAPAVLAMRWTGLQVYAWWGLGFMVVLGSVIPYLLFADAIKRLAASRAAAFNYLQPVIASSLAIWVLSEKLTVKVMIGGAMILAGVYLAERERGEALEPAPQTAGAL